MLGILPLFQLVASFGDTAQALQIVAPRQLDGVADLLAVEVNRSVGSLFSVCPSENQGAFQCHLISPKYLHCHSNPLCPAYSKHAPELRIVLLPSAVR